MLSVAKLATPLTAATVVVPASTPPAGLVQIGRAASRHGELGTVVPAASCAATCTAGVSVVPAGAFAGCPVHTRWVAAPGVMPNGVLVAAVRPVGVTVRV